ncbi:MAG: hypothetical protein WAO09_01515 [Candidatus Dormiibacterota bacterium]|jgi:hypothetical protein
MATGWNLAARIALAVLGLTLIWAASEGLKFHVPQAVWWGILVLGVIFVVVAILPTPRKLPSRLTALRWGLSMITALRFGSGLLVISAKYGANGKWRNVRRRVRKQIMDGRVDMDVNNVTMGRDPIYGLVKALKLTYRVGRGAIVSVEVPENERLSIP